MKLRVYLLSANIASTAVIVVLLLVFYRFMLLSEKQFLWLSVVSLSAGLLSVALHFMLVRPVEAAVKRIGEGSARVADGDFGARVPLVGPAELKALASQFNEMGWKLEASFKQLQAAEGARRELVANMAHDLRTPLASLQAYAEALEDGVLQDEAIVRRYIGTIRSESVRLGNLIRQLFELSTLDAAEMPGALRRRETEQPETSLLEDVLIELLPRFAPLAEAGSVALDVRMPERTLRCAMPSQPLQRVIQNLLENALRHSPAGGVVRIEGEQLTGAMVRITVSDQGQGVPEAERTRIFERFYRVDRSRTRNSGGAGLGLSIAKSLVEQAGGRIGVDCGKAGGSTFWFTVPAA
ncbi:sensor histidine kinase [Paenibacillus humicola]|uniref:sensor histidine kinase n=1 Tax=Paenibacillus humicola TaxID=3110540 RepID=UPI00237AA0A3|nr:ATP-binding protein [Paenibacillus humicola]